MFSEFQCDFWKGFGTHYYFLLMTEKWEKKAVNNKIVFDTVLTDLSDAFDCKSHDLLIAK